MFFYWITFYFIGLSLPTFNIFSKQHRCVATWLVYLLRPSSSPFLLDSNLTFFPDLRYRQMTVTLPFNRSECFSNTFRACSFLSVDPDSYQRFQDLPIKLHLEVFDTALLFRSSIARSTWCEYSIWASLQLI